LTTLRSCAIGDDADMYERGRPYWPGLSLGRHVMKGIGDQVITVGGFLGLLLLAGCEGKNYVNVEHCLWASDEQHLVLVAREWVWNRKYHTDPMGWASGGMAYVPGEATVVSLAIKDANLRLLGRGDEPRGSPKGNRVAFFTRGGAPALRVADVSGDPAKDLAFSEMPRCFCWLPDGRRLIVGWEHALEVIDSDTGRREKAISLDAADKAGLKSWRVWNVRLAGEEVWADIWGTGTARRTFRILAAEGVLAPGEPLPEETGAGPAWDKAVALFKQAKLRTDYGEAMWLSLSGKLAVHLGPSGLHLADLATSQVRFLRNITLEDVKRLTNGPPTTRPEG